MTNKRACPECQMVELAPKMNERDRETPFAVHFNRDGWCVGDPTIQRVLLCKRARLAIRRSVRLGVFVWN